MYLARVGQANSVITRALNSSRQRGLASAFDMSQGAKGKGSGKSKGIPGKEKPVLRHVRYIQKKGPVAPSTIDMQVVGTGAGSSPRAVTCDFTHSRYLFNCSEGTQRVCVEHKMRLAKLENIFITHTSWKNVGGLLGMALTLDGVNVPKVTVHGPPDAGKLVQLSRQFAPIRNIQFQKRDINEGQYKDSGMTVDSIPLYPDTEAGHTDLKDTGNVNEPATKKKKLSLSEEMAVYSQEQTKESNARNMSVAYVCSPIQKPKPVSLEKCMKLGLAVGPLIGKLKGGETVTLDDGRVIKPEDILDDAEPELPFIVVEAPTEEYLNSLLGNEEFGQYQSTEERQVQVIVHFTSPSVMGHPKYQEWMNRFHGDVDHLVVNDSGSPICFEGLYALQAKLNMIHPTIFPLMPHLKNPELYLPNPQTDQKHIIGETALKYLIRVGQAIKNEDDRLSRENCFKLATEEYQSDIHPESEFEVHLKDLKEKIKDMEYDGADKPKYPEMLFLGTGSSMPNKDRNVSAILIKAREDEYMLLDCGEDTYGQLYRNYEKETAEMLRHINSIFLSHLHADHHMGLYGVLEQRFEAFKEIGQPASPVHLLVTENIRDWLESLALTLNADVMSQVKLVPLEQITHNSDHFDVKVATDSRTYLNMQLLQAVRVSHRGFPFGIVMTHQDGWKLSYSGDTMPCRTFVSVGEGSDILIHEATMEDDMLEEAQQKRHSTMSQAIAVGQEMNAKFIMLTHFSQRYSKIPLFNDKFGDNVGIAFDNMQVNPQQLHLLPFFKTALRALFYEHYQEMEARAIKHNRRKLIQKGFTSADSVQSLAEKQLEDGALGSSKDMLFGKVKGKRERDVKDIFEPKFYDNSEINDAEESRDTRSLIDELKGKPSGETLDGQPCDLKNTNSESLASSEKQSCNS